MHKISFPPVLFKSSTLFFLDSVIQIRGYCIGENFTALVQMYPRKLASIPKVWTKPDMFCRVKLEGLLYDSKPSVLAAPALCNTRGQL